MTTSPVEICAECGRSRPPTKPPVPAADITHCGACHVPFTIDEIAALFHEANMSGGNAARQVRRVIVDDLIVSLRAKTSVTTQEGDVAAKVFVVHVYNAADQLHDYSVHQTVEGAVLQAAADVVAGRFEDLDPDARAAEVLRVVNATYEEPGVGLRHVRCDAWHAHVDEMSVSP